MVIFKKKKKRYLDLGKKLSRNEEKIENVKSFQSQKNAPLQEQENSPGFFTGFFGSKEQNSNVESSVSSEEKKEKLRARIIEMTNRIEENEREISQLKQRIEFIERRQKADY